MPNKRTSRMPCQNIGDFNADLLKAIPSLRASAICSRPGGTPLPRPSMLISLAERSFAAVLTGQARSDTRGAPVPASSKAATFIPVGVASPQSAGCGSAHGRLMSRRAYCPWARLSFCGMTAGHI